jgi:hypothetical protein
MNWTPASREFADHARYLHASDFRDQARGPQLRHPALACWHRCDSLLTASIRISPRKKTASGDADTSPCIGFWL